AHPPRDGGGLRPRRPGGGRMTGGRMTGGRTPGDRGVLVVTGGGRGIGAATALAAAAAGYAVCVNYARDARAADATVRAIPDAGGKAVAVQGDVGVEADVIATFAAAAGLGPVTGLVNNAGISGPIGRVADVSVQTLESVFRINVTGAFL